MSAAFRDGGKLLVFGNGGSAADATHLSAELVGRFLVERPGLPAISLSDNASAVTSIANDYAYERVFARQVEALGLEKPDQLVEGLAARWQQGTLGLRPADASLQAKEVPLETFFHKIVMIRNNLRVLRGPAREHDR